MEIGGRDSCPYPPSVTSIQCLLQHFTFSNTSYKACVVMGPVDWWVGGEWRSKDFTTTECFIDLETTQGEELQPYCLTWCQGCLLTDGTPTDIKMLQEEGGEGPLARPCVARIKAAI